MTNVLLKNLFFYGIYSADFCLNLGLKEVPWNNVHISELQYYVRPEPVEGRELRPHVLCQSPFDKLRMNGASSKCRNYFGTIPKS